MDVQRHFAPPCVGAYYSSICQTLTDGSNKHSYIQTSVYHIVGSTQLFNAYDIINITCTEQIKRVANTTCSVSISHTITFGIHCHCQVCFTQLNTSLMCNHYPCYISGPCNVQLSLPYGRGVIALHTSQYNKRLHVLTLDYIKFTTGQTQKIRTITRSQDN